MFSQSSFGSAFDVYSSFKSFEKQTQDKFRIWACLGLGFMCRVYLGLRSEMTWFFIL